MEKSPSIKNLAAALIVFHMKVDKIKKDATNPFFKKKYASLSNILEAIQIPLSESGMSFSQLPTGSSDLTTILMHADSGEFMMAEYTMESAKSDPQSKGSALTYQRRYALCAILGLNIEEDDDANGATQPPQARRNGEQSTNGTTDGNLPWLNENTPQYDGALKKLKAGTTTIAKIKTVMRLSKAVEAKLNAAIKN